MAEIVIKLVNGDLAGQTAQTLAKNYKEAALAANKATIGTQEWVDAQKKLADSKGLLDANKSQIEGITKASDSLKQSFGGILNQIPGFSQISGAFQQAQGSIGGLSSSFGTLKTAIAASGIGLLVLAVSTLVMWFSKTEAGANTLAGAFKSLGNVVDLIFGKLMSVGKAIGELFVTVFNAIKGPLGAVVTFVKDAITDMLKPFTVMYDFLVTKFPAVGKFFDAVKEKVVGFATEIANAAKEGYEFIQMMDDIEDRQAAMEITAKKNEILVDQLLLQAKNVGKTYEDRIALLDKADAITRKSYQDQLALSKEYQNAVNKEIDAEKKRQGVQDDTDEQRDKRKDAELAYLNLVGQQIELEEKIANRREQILGKQEKADDKAAADLQKRLDEEEKALKAFYDEEDKIRDLHNQAREDSREKDLEQVKLNLQKQIEALDTDSPLYAEHLSAAQELARKQRADVNAKWDKTDADRSKKAADDEKKIASEKAKFEANLAQQRLDIEKGVTDGIGQLLLQGAKNEKDAKVIRKTFAIADIGFNLGKELSANALAAAENPLNGVTFGAAGAAQLAATNLKSILFAGINVAKVLAFRRGGVLNGPSHEWGGIPIEAEGDEIILTKGVYRNPALRAMASSINAAGGGVRFAGGGVAAPTNPYSDTSRSPISSQSDPFQGIAELKQSFLMYAKAMDERIDRLQVHNNVQDTTKQQQRILQIQNDANI